MSHSMSDIFSLRLFIANYMEKEKKCMDLRLRKKSNIQFQNSEEMSWRANDREWKGIEINFKGRT